MRTEDLIAELTDGLRPVRRLAPPGRRAALWLCFAALAVGSPVALFGLRPDLASRLALPHEAMQLAASLATGVLAAVAAFHLALPDRSPRWALLPLPTLALWLGSLGWGCMADAARLGPGALVLGTSWGCLRFILGLGVPLMATMLWALRHAGPVRPVPVVLLGALAAASLCSFGLSLFHRLDAAAMVLAWHGGATALMLLIGWAFGRPALIAASAVR
ncbi:MAG: DUF1109 domain-containing protein [Acetobacteraceae bacterium]|nr:DUF1109 domain-containing protein [Acetobacteraceae bacterium]